MSKRAVEDKEWASHKNAILQLYVEESQPLSTVMNRMRLDHGFDKSKSKYERRLRTWGIKKYSKEEEWKIIASCIEDRKACGKLSVVQIRGTRIPEKKLYRELSRHTYTDTLSRIRKELNPENRPSLPQDVRIFTPSISPPPTYGRLISTPIISSTPLETSSVEIFIELAKETPWAAYMQLACSLANLNAGNLLHLPRSIASDVAQASSQTQECISSATMAVLPLVTANFSPKMNTWINDVLGAKYLNCIELNPFDYQQHQIYTRPRSFLPSLPDFYPEINMDTDFSVFHKGTQLQFLNVAVTMLSDNHNASTIAEAVVELAEDSRNRELLQRLLEEKLLSLQAFAEKLLPFAALAGSLALVKILVEAGADVDAEASTSGSGYICALMAAIRNDHGEIVEYLLENGASIDRPNRFDPLSEPLTLAVYKGNVSIVKKLIRTIPVSECGERLVLIELALYALRNGSHELVRAMLQDKPCLREKIKTEPAILQFAGFCGGVEMFEILGDFGFDVEVMPCSQYGSALAAATYSQDIHLITYLLSKGVDVNGIGLQMRDVMPGLYCSVNHYTIIDMAPLHVLLMNHDNVDLLRTLLDYGADPNLPCLAISPLQIAAAYRDVALVRQLLEAGADANADPLPAAISSMPEPPMLISEKNVSAFRRWHLSARPIVQIAIERGDLAIVTALLENDDNRKMIEKVDYYPFDLLASAFVGRNLELVNLVISHTRPLALKNPSECLVACINNFGGNFAKSFIDQGVYEFSMYLHHPAVLCAAVWKGDADFVKMLLSTAIHKYGKIPPEFAAPGMIIAVRKHSRDLISMFLGAGVEPYTPVLQDVYFDRGWRAEWAVKSLEEYTVRSGYTAMKALLSWAFFDEALRTGWEETAQMLAQACIVPEHELDRETLRQEGLAHMFLIVAEECVNGMMPILRAIMDTAVDFDAALIWSRQLSALQVVINHNLFDLARDLIQAGADINQPARNRWYEDGIRYGPYHTVLQCAARGSRPDLVQELIAKQADVNADPATGYGATALQFAAIVGNFEICNLLLEAGAHVNAPQCLNHGRTAIEGAAEYGRINMVRYLLEAGADISGKHNKNYRRTVYRAWKGGHRTLGRMVQDWKIKRYGLEDGDSVKEILNTMTSQELEEIGPREIGPWMYL